ncbi:MAG TPA: hypothetical protein VGX23_19475 [Actinocrinis sp.]|nr:hypothetical protein [Actinocrinis sp.]
MSATGSSYLACVVHVPLLKLQGRSENTDLWKAYDARVAEFEAFDPDLVFVFGGDHYDNIFLNLAPQFMIGHRARAIDDCGGYPGPLDVPTEVTKACADYLVEAGFDLATSYDMNVDHGFSNVLGNFLGRLDAKPVIPIHVNALAKPRPTLRRCRELGEAVGTFAAGLGKKAAFLGSGGMSHQTDSIFPQFDTAPDDTVRDYIVSGGSRGTVTREAFITRIKEEMDVLSGQLVSGELIVPWINAEWDRRFLDAFATGDLSVFDTWTDQEISAAAGDGAGEVRQWVAAAAAAQAAGAGERIVDYYSPDTTLAVGAAVAHSRIG